MFGTSTQRNHWCFASEDVLNGKRRRCNTNFIRKFRGSRTDTEVSAYFLSPEEEAKILVHYEVELKKFCKAFTPTLLEAVIGTSFHYFKRFYLFHSVMDYHPKEISLTCVYLACKIEEFNLTMPQFLNNVTGNKDKWSEVIINNEMLLMETMKFQLLIHNPYIPREGFLLDTTARAEQFQTVANEAAMRPFVDSFLETVLFTDCLLIYTHVQIALAAVLHAATKTNGNIDKYVTEAIARKDPKHLEVLIKCVKSIRKSVAQRVKLEKEGLPLVDDIKQKLEVCRNPANNPESDLYKSRMADDLVDTDEEDVDFMDM